MKAFRLEKEQLIPRDQIPGAVGVVLYFDNQTIQNSVQAWQKKQIDLFEKDEAATALSAWEFMFPKTLADDTMEQIRAYRKRGSISEDDLKG